MTSHSESLENSILKSTSARANSRRSECIQVPGFVVHSSVLGLFECDLLALNEGQALINVHRVGLMVVPASDVFELQTDAQSLAAGVTEGNDEQNNA
jgi:hypothetical protein